MSMDALGTVLAYRHDALVRSFARKKKISLLESCELFTDLLTWLWFLGNRRYSNELPDGFPSLRGQQPIDAYWHEFILDTRAYQAFCSAHLGGFLHHVPTPDGLEGASQDLAQTDPEQVRAITKSLLRRAMREVYLSLGKEVMLRWYVDIPKRYASLIE